MDATIELLEKLSQEERLEYINSRIRYRKVRKVFENKRDEASRIINELRGYMQEASHQGISWQQLAEEDGLGYLSTVQEKISQLNDLKENFKFIHDNSTSAENEFFDYIKGLYEKHEMEIPSEGIIYNTPQLNIGTLHARQITPQATWHQGNTARPGDTAAF